MGDSADTFSFQTRLLIKSFLEFIFYLNSTAKE